MEGGTSSTNLFLCIRKEDIFSIPYIISIWIQSNVTSLKDRGKLTTSSKLDIHFITIQNRKNILQYKLEFV